MRKQTEGNYRDSGRDISFFTKGKGVNDMRKHGNGLEVGRAGTMEVKATKGAESTKAPKKQTGGDLRSTKR